MGFVGLWKHPRGHSADGAGESVICGWRAGPWAAGQGGGQSE